MQILSVIWGILAILGMAVGFMPCFGSLNWVNIPFAILGLLISVIAVVVAKGQGKVAAIAGLIMCGIAAVFGLVRLIAGGGVF